MAPKMKRPRWVWRPTQSEPLVLVLCWLVAIEIGLSFVLGGSAAERGPVAGLLLAVALILMPLGTWLVTRPPSNAAIAPYLLLAAIAILPLLQLIPLSPMVWIPLPGRGEVLRTLNIMGVPPPAMAFSLTPGKTWDAFFWLMVPAAVFIGTSALERRLRVWLSAVIILFMVLSLGLGGLQMNAGAGQSLQFYEHVHRGLPIGFFANRNHQAIALAVCLPLIAANVLNWAGASRGARQLGQFVFIALAGLFTAGILMTQSRAGLVLGGLGLMIATALYFLGGHAKADAAPRRGWFLAMVFVTVIVVQIGIGAVLSRFGAFNEEGRFEFWPLVMQEALKLQPWGSGLGSFDAVFRSIEPISMLDGFYLNEAHNDYLQLFWEAGIAFPALLLAFLVWFGVSVRAALRRSDKVTGRLVIAASAGIFLLLLHSVVDYPLRTPALASVFAYLCGCLTRPPPPASIGVPAVHKAAVELVGAKRSKTRGVRRRKAKVTAD